MVGLVSHGMVLQTREVFEWPTSVQSGYIFPAVWGLPNALERGTKSAVAVHHKRRVQTKVTVSGNNDLYQQQNLVMPSLVHTLFAPPPL